MSRDRVNDYELDLLEEFLTTTFEAWMAHGLIKPNSWGCVVLVAKKPGSDFTGAKRREFGSTREGAEHPRKWYIENADGKKVACLETGMDSHEAVRLWQGLVTGVEGIYPWGGAVIDTDYGLIVSISGFEEDEDILCSRTGRNRLVMMMDRAGEANLNDARQRGKQEGEAAADRFTR
jgi:hypothetical protein